MQSQNQAQLDKNHHKNSNLWLGFTFGAASAAAIFFFLGTKKGRQILKKILEMSEDLEENALAIAQQIEEVLIEKSDKTNPLKEEKPNLGNILEKMKILRN